VCCRVRASSRISFKGRMRNSTAGGAPSCQPVAALHPSAYLLWRYRCSRLPRSLLPGGCFLLRHFGCAGCSLVGFSSGPALVRLCRATDPYWGLCEMAAVHPSRRLLLEMVSSRLRFTAAAFQITVVLNCGS